MNLTIRQEDRGWKEIVNNLSDGSMITLTVGGLKSIILNEKLKTIQEQEDNK